MRALLRTWPCRAVSSLIALTLATTTGLSTASIAAAAGTNAPASGPQSLPAPTASGVSTSGPVAPDTEAVPDVAEAPAAASDTSPTVVGEITSRRTATEKHFRLSDGTSRAEIYPSPVHYKDAGGRWADIDRSVVPGGLGEYRNDTAAVKSKFESEFTSDGSLTLSKDAWSVNISTPGMASAIKAGSGNKVTYLGIGQDTSLKYETLGDGVEETFILASPEAPDTFNVDLKLTGLELRTTPSGEWLFMRPGTGTIEGTLSSLVVFDSSKDASGTPAYCEPCTMTVLPNAQGAHLTYEVSRAWLEDPARVYPVQVDPTYTFQQSSMDTWVWQYKPNNTYSSDQNLYTGYYKYNTTQKGYARALVKFDTASLASKFIRSAALRMWTWQASPGDVAVGRVDDTWGSTTTWNNQPSHVTWVASLYASNTGVNEWPVRGTVQGWTGGGDVLPVVNNGFKLQGAEANTALVWLFGGRNYPDINARPKLVVDYVDPAANISAVGTNTTGGVPTDGAHEVTATVRVLSTARSDIRQVRMIGNLAQYADPADFRGHMVWYAYDPGTAWPLKRDLGSGKGWIACDPNETYYNTDLITPLLGRCSATATSVAGAEGYDISFVYRPKEDFDYPTGNTVGFQVGYGMTGGAAEWASQWYTMGPSFNVVPASPSVSATGTPLPEWYVEIDTNSDGIPDSREDTGTAGRGVADLAWGAVAGETGGYKVYLSDGNAWRDVGTLASGATSWSSSGKGLYPKDSGVFAAGATSNPFLSGTGFNLRDDPTPLYARTAGTALDAFPGYAFKIAARNEGGETPISACPTITVQLPKRTSYLNEEPADTTAELGEFAGHTAAAVLDSQPGDPARLELDVTDLSVASWGPEALLSRHYSSAVTSSSAWEPGWRFSFEQSLVVNGSVATYTDASGQAHRFMQGGIASGGTKYTSGPNTIHVFNGSGTLSVAGTISGASVLVVGGGGGGYGNLSGGGGGGGVLTGTQNVSDAMPVVVGAGGAANSANGGNSSLGTITAIGGGRGASRDVAGQTAGTGGSGGGGAGATPANVANVAAGAGTAGQGNSGSAGQPPDPGVNSAGGGGGGAGGGALVSGYRAGGNGGPGRASSITGTVTYYGGGGGGSSYYTAGTGGVGGGGRGQGGTGGGGSGSTAGAANTGGGGGGGSAGGSGIVVVSYPTPVYGASWVAPKGFAATLTRAQDNTSQLVLKGGNTLKFNSSGRLIEERDRSGNVVTYNWTGYPSNVTITAANGQTITVGMNAGRVTEATYLGRHIHYSPAGATPTVSYYVGAPEARSVEYTYSAGRLIGLRVPEFTPANGARAEWSFSYAGSAVSQVRYPGYASDPHRRCDADYGSGWNTAVLTRFGEVDGNADTSIPTTYNWSQTGAMLARSNPASSAVTAYEYSVTGSQLYSVSPLGKSTASLTDLRGNVVQATDEAGAITRTVYDANDDPVEETDARGATTYRTYSGGKLMVEEKILETSGARSRTEYGYDAYGRMTMKRSKIDADTWARTDYEDFAPNGQPRKTTEKAVKLSASGDPEDLQATVAYDDYGSVLSETNALLDRTVLNTVDLAGRVLSSEDASGVVTNTRFDALSDAIETWRSHESTTAKIDWRESTFDGESRVLVETVKGSAGAFVASITHVYDTLGRETSSDNSSVGGVNVTRYDAAGNATKVWSEGAKVGEDVQATRVTTNSDGQPTTQLAPGATTAATVTTYNASGQATAEQAPDGSAASTTYTQAGDVASQSSPTDAGTATTTFSNNLDGQTTAQTDPDGSVTTTDYDLMGREVGTRIAGQQVTSTTYNTLGWVLAQTEFDGFAKSKTYDAAGRVLTEVDGGQQTGHVFDALGRDLLRSNPDGSSVTTGRDCFGRTVLETQVGTNGALARRTETTYDTAGRVCRAEVTPQGLVRTWAYDPAGPVTITETRPGGRTLTSDLDSTGLLVSIAGTLAGRSVDWSVTATDTAGRVIGAVSSTFVNDWSVLYDQAGRPYRQETTPTAGVSGQGVPPEGGGNGGMPGGLGLYTYSPTTGKKVHDSFSFVLRPSEETTYTYDVTNRVSRVEISGAATTYSYSAASGALTGYRRPNETTTTLTYDTAGRLASVACPSGTMTYTHDATTGQRRTISGFKGGTTYTWSGERLASVTGPGGVSAFTYDATGQRSRSVVTTAGVTTTTDYTYDGLRLLGLAASRSDSATYSLDYLYDERGIVFAGVYGSSETTAVPFLMSTTDRGDVRELIDKEGHAFALYSYDVYGNPGATLVAGTSLVDTATATAIASRQPLRYASYVWDEAASLYYCSQRYYDPAVAAFISRDPARADGEESAYQYCGGDPVGKTDPSGEWSKVFQPKPFRDNLSYFVSVMRTDAGYARAKLAAAIKTYGWHGGVPMFFHWLVAKVASGHDWDFKASWGQQRDEDAFRLGKSGPWMSIDDFGNLHYGYVFAAVGQPQWFAKAGATAFGLKGAAKGKDLKDLQKSVAKQLQTERANNYWIGRGYQLFNRYGAGSYKSQNQYRRGSGGRGWA